MKAVRETKISDLTPFAFRYLNVHGLLPVTPFMVRYGTMNGMFSCDDRWRPPGLRKRNALSAAVVDLKMRLL